MVWQRFAKPIQVGMFADIGKKFLSCLGAQLTLVCLLFARGQAWVLPAMQLLRFVFWLACPVFSFYDADRLTNQILCTFIK